MEQNIFSKKQEWNSLLFKMQQAQHERGVGHKYFLESKERGEEQKKHDSITIDK